MSIYEKTMRLFDKTKEAADKRAKGSGKGARPYADPKGTGPGPWGARPWSVDGETVTVVLDRRTAENAYYALALALGGVDWPEAVGEWKMTGKTHKGNGKTVGKPYPFGKMTGKTLKGITRPANFWGITILEVANGTVDFRPDVPGAQSGDALRVRQGDIVNWNNRTNRALVLESIPPGIYLTEEIPAGSASSPMFLVTQEPATRITYSCKDPSQQQHSIVVK